ncbi:hypothetical protein [Deminuibacter soli]|uniref:Uncharacterized protein n=1 Tax=Deminuibacter soli TaxID=2291815 RepID=A0A3E1NI86_9BACT|nr:hypothetical protein [Deminuibacter soli]RFM27655.1 hypothetical protein DXN05_13160 [Deminuibacter soli]
MRYLGFDNDASNTTVTWLKNDGADGTPKIGPGILLKVMAGDQVLEDGKVVKKRGTLMPLR